MKDPLRQARYLITETDPLRLPSSTAEVAFVGRSNVGKSSTICALCDNKKLARVSKAPGRTRGINVFEARRGYWLVDLPGYGFAAVPDRQRDYWPKMIARYLSGRPNLKRVFVLLDGEMGLGPIDLEMLQWLKDQNIATMIVGTKVDRLSYSRQPEYRAKMAEAMGLTPQDIHWTSAKQGYGIKALQGEVIQALGI